jgi:phage-related protein
VEATEEKGGKKMVESQKEIQDSLDDFVKAKESTVIWKTPEGAKQLQEVIDYKKNNPNVAIKTLCEYLKNKCGWTYSHRYIFDLIVERLESKNVA